MTLTLKACVRGGRLIVDEPVDLPEGCEVDLFAVDLGDSLDNEDRARLHEALERAQKEFEASAELRLGKRLPPCAMMSGEALSRALPPF